MVRNKREWKFDPQLQIDYTVEWIRKYFVKNGGPDTKAVIGISGGKDSTIAAALLVRALGKDKVVGVMMPQGTQKDIDDSKRVCEVLGIENHTVNIGYACTALYEDFTSSTTMTLNPQIETNTPARIRMAVLYMVAATVGGRVVNTGNWSEGWIGYTTKYGDLAGDFHLFQCLTVREVLMMGRIMEELPRDLVDKAPTDGMSGKTDEDNMGVTYNQIDDYLLLGIVPDVDTWRNMSQRNERNEHKKCINLPGPFAEGRNDHFDWSF